MLALQDAFRACNIGATAGNPQQLLFGNAITCTDNQNNGLKRVTDTLSQLSVETFYGSILFSSFRQNFAGQVSVVQVSCSRCCS